MTSTTSTTTTTVTAPVGIKVFVGNLSFKTTEAELADAFKPSGKILNAHIITTPSNRSKGYGFVEFENKADAEKSVAAMSKKDLGGRPINVELARPQQERSEQAPRERRPPRRFQGGRQNDNNNGSSNNNNQSGSQTHGGRPRRTYNNRTTTNNSNGNGKTEVQEEDDNGERRRPRRPRRYQERRTEEVENRTPSKTMLFVANLAWEVTDASFIEFLKKEGIKFQSANVVFSKSGRSRGYGFINCDNNDEQKRALDILNKREMVSRPLNVKVANASSETPRVATVAPTTTTTTTTATPAPTQSTPAPETK